MRGNSLSLQATQACAMCLILATGPDQQVYSGPCTVHQHTVCVAPDRLARTQLEILTMWDSCVPHYMIICSS